MAQTGGLAIGRGPAPRPRERPVCKWGASTRGGGRCVPLELPPAPQAVRCAFVPSANWGGGPTTRSTRVACRPHGKGDGGQGGGNRPAGGGAEQAAAAAPSSKQEKVPPPAGGGSEQAAVAAPPSSPRQDVARGPSGGLKRAAWTLLFCLVSFCAGVLLMGANPAPSPWSIPLSTPDLTKALLQPSMIRLEVYVALLGLSSAFVEGLIRLVRRLTGRADWESSTVSWVVLNVYKPLERLLWIIVLTKAVDETLGKLTGTLAFLGISAEARHRVMQPLLSCATIAAAATVVRNVGKRYLKEQQWAMEILGRSSESEALSGIERTYGLLVTVVALVAGLQNFGFDVKSLLALGGIGSLAVGLAGRDILENLFSGMVILTSNPFRVGEEVVFNSGGQEIQGIVADVGWYRTSIRSFDREVYNVPNAFFSRSVVLNVTRKGREFRFLHTIPLEFPVGDLDAPKNICADIRSLVSRDPRVITKLFRRVFISGVARGEMHLYVAFYLTCANRDQFLSFQEDFLFQILSIVQRRGGKVAEHSRVLSLTGEMRAGLLGAEGPVPDRLQGADSEDDAATGFEVQGGIHSSPGGSGGSEPEGVGVVTVAGQAGAAGQRTNAAPVGVGGAGVGGVAKGLKDFLQEVGGGGPAGGAGDAKHT